MNKGQIPSVAERSLFQSKGNSCVLESVEVRNNKLKIGEICLLGEK